MPSEAAWGGGGGVWVAGGYAAVVALAYAILFLPLTVAGIAGVIVYGIGLLPLTPLLSFLVSIRLLGVSSLITAREMRHATVPMMARNLAIGAGVALLVFAGINGIPWLTNHWARQVVKAGSTEEARTPLQWLRRLGREETLLRACYSTVTGFRDMPGGYLDFSGQPPAAEAARDIYYQVTGRPFNSVPPPQSNYRTARWGYLDDWTWDEAHGGEAVAGRIKGLTLQQSRLDGLADPEAGWSYVEWIMEFKNTGSLDREARAQIALPPGGVVSRLTLWVNGEEREAAFAGTSKVRKAYQEVAVRQRRDPVLVTSAGLDRVMMQCFPVPRDGGTIKVRLGVTAPWVLESEERAAFRVPYFLERNFGMVKENIHSVWVESGGALECGILHQERSQADRTALRGDLSDVELSQPTSTIRSKRNQGSRAGWVKDTREVGEDAFVFQGAMLAQPGLVKRLVMVLDGGVSMDTHYGVIAEAVSRLSPGLEVVLVLARDGVEELMGPAVADDAMVSALVEEITALRGVGGQDNQAALLRGVDLASETAGGMVLWIHGPQPVSLDQLEKFSQRVMWRPDQAIRIYDLQTAAGPNRLAEAPEAVSMLVTVPRLNGLGEDLARVLAALRSGAGDWSFVRDRTLEMPGEQSGKESSGHLARLWARDEVLRRIKSGKRSDAVALAAQYQLVTPVSGAVVLETLEQFDRAGLEPVSEDTVPTVPEPSTWVLIAVALLGGGFLRWKKGRVASRF